MNNRKQKTLKPVHNSGTSIYFVLYCRRTVDKTENHKLLDDERYIIIASLHHNLHDTIYECLDMKQFTIFISE